MAEDKKILIVEDDEDIRMVEEAYLQAAGFQTEIAADGEEVASMIERSTFDLILLDLMLPGKSGYDVCKEIRGKIDIPILMVTARTESIDKIRGLGVGADDYIVKPFVPAEVMARVKAILRRVDGGASRKKNIHTFAGLRVDLDTFSVSIQGQDVPLTKKEIEILWILLCHPNQVFTRDHLLDSVWGYDYEGDIRTVDSPSGKSKRCGVLDTGLR